MKHEKVCEEFSVLVKELLYDGYKDSFLNKVEVSKGMKSILVALHQYQLAADFRALENQFLREQESNKEDE